MSDDKGIGDFSWSGVIKWGGISLFVSAAILALFVISIMVLQQPLPLPPQQLLEEPAVPTSIFVLAMIGELLLMPAGLGLYFALKGAGKTRAFFATALWLLAPPMFIASRCFIIAIAMMSDRYLHAGSATLKTAYLASAELALEIQTAFSATGLILLSVASILMGLAMIKGEFGKRLGYLAILAGIFSISSPFQVVLHVPIVISFIGLVLTAIWQWTAGIKLYRLGKSIQ